MADHAALSEGRTAVVTGAGGGIGLATCRELARRGLRIEMVDVADEPLANGRDALVGDGAKPDAIATHVVDVADASAIEALAERLHGDGADVAFLMNNAAAFARTRAFDDAEGWRKTIETNLLGVHHGLRAFVPAMVASGRPGVVVNTGSKQGITNPPGNAAYNAAKAAVKSLTEGLQHELRNTDGCAVTAHLLVPGFTNNRHFPSQDAAWDPEQVAAFLFDALSRGDFYVICPDNETTPEMDRKRILWGAMDLTENRPPLTRWHPDWKDAFERFDP